MRPGSLPRGHEGKQPEDHTFPKTSHCKRRCRDRRTTSQPPSPRPGSPQPLLHLCSRKWVPKAVGPGKGMLLMPTPAIATGDHRQADLPVDKARGWRRQGLSQVPPQGLITGPFFPPPGSSYLRPGQGYRLGSGGRGLVLREGMSLSRSHTGGPSPQAPLAVLLHRTACSWPRASSDLDLTGPAVSISCSSNCLVNP